MNCSPGSGTFVHRNACLPEGPGHLRHQRGLRRERGDLAAVLLRRSEQDALGGARPDCGRADASKPNMGMTVWAGSRPRRSDAGVAKNYLAQGEIETLNLIVSAYLDFAELQARSRKPMTMRGWIAKLDDFLRLSDRELLTHPGTISHDAALVKAQAEFDKFRALEDAKPRPLDADLEKAIEQTKQIAAARPKRKPREAK